MSTIQRHERDGLEKIFQGRLLLFPELNQLMPVLKNKNADTLSNLIRS